MGEVATEIEQVAQRTEGIHPCLGGGNGFGERGVLEGAPGQVGVPTGLLQAGPGGEVQPFDRLDGGLGGIFLMGMCQGAVKKGFLIC